MNVDWLLGSEAESFLCHIRVALAEKWEKSHSVVVNWVCTRLLFLQYVCNFAVCVRVRVCVHSSCTKWRYVCVMDDASFPVTIY